MRMLASLFALLFGLGAAVAQPVPPSGGGSIVVNTTPVQNGVNGDCLAVSGGVVGQIACPLTTLPPLAAPFLGEVASGPVINNTKSGSHAQVQTRFPMVMKAALASGKVAYVLWCGYVNPAVGEATNGDCTWTGSYEYPAGTVQQMTCAGSATCSATAGNIVVTDFFATPAPVGEMFWTVLLETSTTQAVLRSMGLNVANGAITQVGDGLTDRTLTPGSLTNTGVASTAPASNASFIVAPAAVIGQTMARSFCFDAGNSRVAGTGDTFSGSNSDIGALARSVGQFAPYINLGVGSDTFAAYIASHTARLALSQYCSDHILLDAVNDLFSASASAATVEGYYTTIKGLLGGNVSAATIAPSSTSSTVSISSLVANGNGLTASVATTWYNYVGEQVLIAGATPSTDNGPCLITQITSNTSFLCLNPNATGSATATGTITYAPGVSVSYSSGTTVGGFGDQFNQAASSSTPNTNRVAVNEWLRNNSAGFHAILDVALLVEAGYNSGTWALLFGRQNGGPCTADGLHKNQACYIWLRDSGIISARTLNFLLKRDIDPAGNDNTPMFQNKAA